MPAVEAAVSDGERRKKSVYYQACTSPYKDDFPTLVKCLRSPELGNPHTRQEAGFLLWHHALEGNNLGGLISAGLLTGCVENLDSPELLPADKACSAGILLALACDDEDTAEQLVRCRAPSGRTSLEVLHVVLRDDAALARQYCSRLLQALARQVAPTVLRAMDNQLPYLSTYMDLWAIRDHRDPTAVAAVVDVADLLLEQRPELSSSVVEAGCLEALVDVIRSHKSEVTISRALNCLSKLLTLEVARERLIRSGGIPLLVDVLGPPPRAALENWPESIEEEISAASAPETPRPPLLSPTSMAAAARHASDTDGGGASRYLDEEAAVVVAAVDVGGGNVNGGNDGDGSGGGGDNADAATSEAAAGSQRDLELGPDGTRRTNSYERFGSQSSRGIMKGANSTAGSPKGRGAGPGGGGSEWASARTSHCSLGSHSSSSVHVRVQLPLVIPGIPVPSPAAAASALLGTPSLHSQLSSRTSRNAMSHSAEFSAALEGAVGALAASGNGNVPRNGGGTAAGAGGSPPPLPTATDLATNRSGLRWILLPGLEVAGRVATCLTIFMHRPEFQVAVELRLVSHRIVAHIKAVMGPKMEAAEGGGGSSKKGKKKGLGLTSEQTMGLSCLLGMLKFLLLYNTTRYRIAKLGAVPMLIRLYNEAKYYLLRNHCQAILAHAALLAENGPALQEAKIPEEFLVANPIRLSSYERAVLRIEFPDDPALLERC